MALGSQAVYTGGEWMQLQGAGMGDEINDLSMFGGLDAAVQVPTDVPTAFNDFDFGSSMVTPDDPWFGASQSTPTTFPTTDGSLMPGEMSGAGINIGKYSDGFLTAGTKLLQALRGNTGQDRSPATGRARPQRSVADLLGLTGSSGTVSAAAPGNQGMWILVAVLGVFLLLMLGGKR